MQDDLSSSIISCPYCGEQIEILLDASAGSHHYIEDCHVCCAPIEIAVNVDISGAIIEIQTKRDCD